MGIAPGIATTMRVFGVLTILICSFTIFVYLKYQKFRSKSLHTIIFYISVCSIFNSIGVCIGLPKNGTAECSLQAFLTNAFPLSVIFWTTTIAYMVFCIIHNAEKIQVNSKQLWTATFALPVILTLLPLSTETYGSPEEDDWCFIKDRASSPSPSWTTLFWSIFCFYGWLYLNVLVYIVLLVMALRHIYVLRRGINRDSITLNKMESSLYKLIWYPLITLVVWLPAAVYDMTELDDDSGGRYTNVQVVLRELWQGRGLPQDTLLETLISAERTLHLSDRGSQESLSKQSSSFLSPSLSLSPSFSSYSSSMMVSQSQSQSQSHTQGLTAAPSPGGQRNTSSTVSVKKKEPAMPNPLGWTADDGDGGDDLDDNNYV